MSIVETRNRNLDENSDTVIIDAAKKYYKVLNNEIYAAINEGAKSIELLNVNGQRYIADGLKKRVKLIINGTPGNNLGSFMDGPEIIVFSNAQEQVANTMNGGKIVILGDASDVVGYGMRGGKVFVRGDVGYRVGIHMKEYKRQVPVIVVGGTTGDFLGEYMAGGIIVVLGISRDEEKQDNLDIVGDYVGTGMHGGAIFVRGKEVPPYRLGSEPQRVEVTKQDKNFLETTLKEFCKDVDFNLKNVMSEPFRKYIPLSHRPYGKVYANQP